MAEDNMEMGPGEDSVEKHVEEERERKRQEALDFAVRSEFYDLMIGMVFKKHQNGADRIAELKEIFKEFLDKEVIAESEELARKLEGCESIEDECEFQRKVSEIIFPIAKLAHEHSAEKKDL